MSDDSPLPPNKRGTNPRSWENLIKSKPGDPSRNPTGKNGRVRREIVAAFMEEPSGSDPDICKGRRVLESIYRRALKGSDQAAKTLLEHWKGKPSQEVDLTSSDGSMSPLGEVVTYRVPDNGRGPKATDPNVKPPASGTMPTVPETDNGGTDHD